MARTVKTADVRQDEILDAAQRLFAERGYSHTPIQAIIDAVGIAKGTFYHHFASKSALLDALIQRLSDQIFQHVEPVLADDSLGADARLLGFFQRIGSAKATQAGLMVDLSRALDADANAHVKARLMQRSNETMSPVLVRIIEEGIEQGVFACAHPHHTAGHVLTVLQASRETWMRAFRSSDGEVVPRAELHAMVDAQQEAIERLLGAKPGSLPLVDRSIIDQFIDAAQERP